MKQYMVTKAYTDNYHVYCFNNGKLETDTIVALWDLSGYLSALENMGYTEGFYVPEHEKKVRCAQEALKYAEDDLAEARKHSINMSTEDAARIFRDEE